MRKYVHFSISSLSSAYAWLLNYVNRRSMHRTRNLTFHTSIDQSESGKASASVQLLPGHGQHIFIYRRRPILVERAREKQTIGGGTSRVALETVTLTTFGLGNSKLCKQKYSDIIMYRCLIHFFVCRI